MIHPLKIKFQKRPLLLGAVFFSLLLSAACLIFFFGRDPDRRFEDYTEALFRREVAGNTISLHFTLQEPRKMPWPYCIGTTGKSSPAKTG